MAFELPSPVIGVPSVSSQSVWLPVSDTAPDGSPINPTVGNVGACATKGEDPTTWGVAAWEPMPIVVDGRSYYLARVDIGTDLVLAKGFYFLWLKLDFVSPPTVIRHSNIIIY